jgi:23S rRNA pseudouridine2605 synthase
VRERLQKILSSFGIASRREAERLIAEGLVEVNGVTARIGQSADPENDMITVNGKPVGPKPEPVYIALYKPRGYVTTLKDERGRKTVGDLVADCGTRVYPAGRLDMDSEGLLILTNDGDVALGLTYPSKAVEKIYRVTVRGTDPEQFEALRNISELDGEPISNATVNVIQTRADRSSLEIIIREGKNRQIRRMCEKVGIEVLRLKRNRIGKIALRGLKPGQWRYLDKTEVRYLKSIR